MASEPGSAARDAALRRLLVDRVESTPAPRATSASPAGPRPAAERGRLRTTLVTAVVSTAVVAVSAAALVLSQTPHRSPADSTRHGTAPDTTVSASPLPSPSTTPTAHLIAHTGWHVISREQLHEFVVTWPATKDDPANGAIWEEQAWLDVQCMADHGYLYDPITQAQQEPTSSAGTGLTAQQLKGYDAAMYGPPTDAPYDWRTAGCHGRSVHETGQDDAH